MEDLRRRVDPTVKSEQNLYGRRDETDLYVPPLLGGVGFIKDSYHVTMSTQKFLDRIPQNGRGKCGISDDAFKPVDW